MSMLKLDNVMYKDILKGISFSIEEGSFNVLIGRNSSGKSTLVKVLAELIGFGGRITFDGDRPDIGFFTEDNLFSYKKVIDNISFILINLGYSRKYAENKSIEMLKYFELEYLKDEEISNLTYSEKRLVEFISCIIHEPKIMVIDDSFDYLKDNERKRIIKKIHDMKCAVLFITNKIEDIFYADQVIVINDGKTVLVDTIDKIVLNEKNFINNKLYSPFILDLSYKFLSYKLIDNIMLDYNKMVDRIWK